MNKMTNKKLLVSSILCGTMHIYYIIHLPCLPLFPTSYYMLGIATSICNHGSNIPLAVYIDRVVMCLGFFVDNYTIILSYHHLHPISTHQRQYLYIAIFSYFVAKLEKSYIFHYITHICITLLHIECLYQYSYYYSMYPTIDTTSTLHNPFE
jgi:hypothetical protein